MEDLRESHSASDPTITHQIKQIDLISQILMLSALETISQTQIQIYYECHQHFLNNVAYPSKNYEARNKTRLCIWQSTVLKKCRPLYIHGSWRLCIVLCWR